MIQGLSNARLDLSNEQVSSVKPSLTTDDLGEATFRIRVPRSVELCGTEVIVQGYIVAPADGPLVFGQVTDAIRFVLGD